MLIVSSSGLLLIGCKFCRGCFMGSKVELEQHILSTHTSISNEFINNRETHAAVTTILIDDEETDPLIPEQVSLAQFSNSSPSPATVKLPPIETIFGQKPNTRKRPKYQCALCPMSVTSKNVHLWQHLDLDQFQCSLCSLTDAKRNIIKLHISIKHYGSDAKVVDRSGTFEQELKRLKEQCFPIPDDLIPPKAKPKPIPQPKRVTRSRKVEIAVNQVSVAPVPKASLCPSPKRKRGRKQMRPNQVTPEPGPITPMFSPSKPNLKPKRKRVTKEKVQNPVIPEPVPITLVFSTPKPKRKRVTQQELQNLVTPDPTPVPLPIVFSPLKATPKSKRKPHVSKEKKKSEKGEEVQKVIVEELELW